MQKNYRKLGDYIQKIDSRNSDSKISYLVGLSITKEFIPSVANIIGTDLSKYKVIRKNQFACSLMQVSRDEKMPIAKFDEDEAIMSPAYPMFEVIDESILLPDYLMMWFSRSEFDREASYYAVGGVRGSLEWEDFCNMELPIPTIEKQREIVAQYQAVENKIKVNEQICEKLEATAQALYKQWFVDFEFPYSPPLEGGPTQEDGVVDNTSPQNQVVKRATHNYKSLPYNPALKERAKKLRKAGNLAEVLFWQQVRNKQFRSLDFDRQKIIGNYIVDFYNANYQIVVEIDGSSHNDKQEYDAIRQAFLEDLGLKVIRYSDKEVKMDVSSVMRHLHEVFQEIDQCSVQEGIIDHPTFQAPLQRREILPYKSSGGKMVYNEELEKEIPEGWEVVKVKNFCDEMKNGATPSRDNLDYWNSRDIPWLKTGEISNNVVFDSEEYISKEGFKNSSTKLISCDSVLMAMYGATAGQLAYLKKEVTTNQACCAMISSDKNKMSFLYYALLNQQNHIVTLANGGAQANLSKQIIEELLLVLPENLKDIELNKFSHIIEQKAIKTLENQKLVQLQALLLSRLARLEEA